MPDARASIEKHYGFDNLADRIVAALATAGQDTADVTVDMLNLVDQMHFGGLNATRRLAEALGLGKGTRVLDAGCGIGGSSRYLAHTYGCRIKAIDLTSQLVEAAARLNKLCDMDSMITVRQGSITALPYDDRSFDLVWCQNVSMHVEDKRRMFAEAYRVLAPGGRYAISHAASGPAGAPYYPLPWAREPSYSFLGTREEFLELLASVGFTKIDCRNDTSEASERRPGELTPATILGADMPERQANAARSAKEGRLVRMFVVAQRPA
jgi:ubiquinone/menaquinone biosynthesis C-methylase UbiE